MIAIDILALDGAGPSALGLTLDALDTANRLAPYLGSERIPWRILTPGRTEVALRHGVTVAAQPIESARARGIVVVLGIGAAEPLEIERRLDRADARQAAAWLRAAHRRGVVLAGACTAVFLLGEAGALEGRRCTTTWWLAGLLAQRCPGARVDADAIVVEDDSVWTGGAMVSQLDLVVALLERHAGAAIAKETVRRLAAPTRVSQAPFIDAGGIAHDDKRVAAFEAYVAANLKRAIVVDDAARAQHTSSRTLLRHIRAATGLSPSRFVQKIRLGSAMRLIEETRLPLETIAARVGLADGAVLHRLFVRHTGQPPGRFRPKPA